MSLRTDYTGALDTALAAARTAGNTSVTVTSLVAIMTAMAAAAASGTKTFTVTIPTIFQPVDLRSEGPLWLAYKSGILQGLASEDLMEGDVEVAIDLSDTISTSVSLNFTF
jgi:hypothetical protein